MSGILNDAAIAEMLGGSEEEGDDSDEIDLDNFTEEYPEYLSSSSSDEGEDSDEDNVPLSMLAGWQKKPFNGKPLPEEALHDPGDIKTPYEYFERYFTVELMEQMALTTNQYYMAKTGIQIKPVCSLLDIKKFFGIHAIVGCIKFPRLKMIWSEKYKSVRFEGSRKKNKPRPAGLKNFVLTTYKGQVLDFEIYQGSTTNLPDSDNFGVGASVVLRLANTLPEGSFLYFDRYFSSLPLMKELTKRKLEGTGTLMANRFNTKKKTLYEFKKDNRMTRGEDEEVVNRENTLSVVKWKDNKGVLMVSTAFGAAPRTQVSRWNKKRKRYIDVSCPAIIKNYNSFMGGVDVCDQMMEVYRTWRKTRKWPVKVIIHMFDLAIVNSWFEYRADCKASNRKSIDIMDLLAFRLSISDHLLNGPLRKRPREDLEFAEMPTTSKYRVKSLPTVDRQYDGFNHWPVFDTLKQPRCCRAPGCSSQNYDKSDEDSGDEESTHINNLSRHQLLAEAELRATVASETGIDVEDSILDAPTIKPMPSTSSAKPPPRKKNAFRYPDVGGISIYRINLKKRL
ncbi:Chimeric ERCC6-PGBD3 protein [Eumeta japonica]|uniref:Chimeric ERCC6-PGBD3 protein n=1 Tax=Eumeta variegata TaxID=151549 RepID=A0A4C1W1V0_EUMVA|nr:Chimeric ERCC6-PGBD3 protein [Eumeta japonica]